MKTVLTIAIAAALLAPPALAQQRTTSVTFAPGATAANVKGSIRGDAGVDYTIQTAAGQTMQLLFAPRNPSCYFNVYAPGDKDSAVHIGSTSGNEFGVYPTAVGVYTARVYLMRNAARRNETCAYTLSVEITGAPGGVSAGVSDQMMIDACKGAAAPMYGVQPRAVTLAGAPGPAKDGGFTLDGTVDKGEEGVKKLRCIYRADRQFSHVQAMTSDGE